MPHDIRTLSRRWFDEVWNNRRKSAIPELSHPHARVFGLAEPGRSIDIGDFLPFYERFLAAFPDIHIQVEDVIVEGDQSALRCHATGTHTGDAMGVPPTGKKVLFTAMIWTRWKDGKIIEGWNEVDMWGLMQQIAPSPPAIPAPKLKAM